MTTGGAVSEEQQLGQVVQAARKAAGLTQQALCQKTGLSYSTLTKIERGAIKAPSIFTIQHIAACLGIGLDQLMQRVPDNKPPLAAKKVSKNGVRFVYFDMNGCLVRFYNHAFARLADDAGVTPDVVESIFWQYNDAINRGDKSVDELNTVLAQRLDMMVDWYGYYLAATEATPGVAELVRWIADNYRVGILTNTMPGLVEALHAAGKLPPVGFETIVDSSVVHALKPEPRIYEVAAEMAGVAPHEILLIDDDNPNLSAAGRLGWQTMGFDPYNPEESIVAVSTALQPA